VTEQDDALDWARDLLVDLIEIPSPSGSEHAVAAHLEQVARELGFPVLRQEVPGYGPNLLIGAEHPSLVLTAHMDTVSAAWEWDGRGVVDGDVVHGLGALDDKGSVVACLLALKLARDGGADLDALPVAVGLTVDEEEDGSGSNALAELTRPRHVIALEGTELEICAAEAGALEGHVVVPGRSHHGSRPELGENAVHKAFDVARELLALEVLNRQHPDLPDGMGNSVFVQEFKGGSDLHVVPDSARFRIVARLGGIGDAEEARQAIEDLCARWGATFELIEAVDPWLTRDDAAVLSLLGDAVRRETGREPVRAAMPSWTDAHSFSETGATSVVFGPGTLRYAHRPDEHIDVREIVTSARILADVVLRSADLP
jgi:acetylornithine deacetylase/succinyl-diaminopimelate desuccinylase-like protein